MIVVQLLRGLRNSAETDLPHDWWFVAMIGLVAGFASMLGNAAGAVMSVYLIARGLPKNQFMGTSAWFYLIVNSVKVPFSATLQLTNPHTLAFAALMIPVVTVGALVGVRVLPLLPQKLFERIVLGVAAAASLRLIISWP